MLYNYRMLFLAGLGLFVTAVIMSMTTNLDEKLNSFFLLDASSVYVYWVKWFSKWGSFVIVLPVSILFLLWVWIYQSHKDAIWFLGILLSARLVFLLMKIVVHRGRPVFPHSLVHATSASFPSGHAVNGLIFVLIMLFCLYRYGFFFWVSVFSLMWVVAVGWSRLALGAHWTSDILAGWGCALMWFSFMMIVGNTVFIQKLFGYGG